MDNGERIPIDRWDVIKWIFILGIWPGLLIGIQLIYFNYFVYCYGTGETVSYWNMPIGNYTNVICTDSMNESQAYGYLNKLILQKYPNMKAIQLGENLSIYPVANKVEVSCIILKEIIGGC